MRGIGPAGVVAGGASIAAVVVGFEAMRRASIKAADSLAELKGEAAVAGLGGVEAYQEFEFMAVKVGISKDAWLMALRVKSTRAGICATRGGRTGC